MDLKDELMVLREALAAARPIPFKKGGDEFIANVSRIMATDAAERPQILAATCPIPVKKSGDEYIDAVSKIMLLDALEGQQTLNSSSEEGRTR